MEELANKVAFITGGASGIGLGIAEALLEARMRVVIADLREDHILAAVEPLQAAGHAAATHAMRVDVTDRAALAAAADEAERRVGRVQVLVNNAGVGIQGPSSGITYADWDFGLAANLGGVVNGLQTFLPRMRAQGQGGHIVNTASLAALVTMPATFVVYVAAKAAVVAILESIRGELGTQDIGVSVLCPGPVRTNIHEAGKNRPTGFDAGAAFKAVEAAATPVGFPNILEPAEVGVRVRDAIQRDLPYVITHGEWRAAVEERHARLIAAMPEDVDPVLLGWLQGPRPG